MIRVIKTKVCPICKVEFLRPMGKSKKVWDKQKCCSTSCANLSRRKHNPLRIRRVNVVAGEGKYKGWRQT